MNPRTKGRIAGAIYDFMGYLTTREGENHFGSKFSPNDLLNFYTEWAYERGLSPQPVEPDIDGWNLGEQVIDAYLKYN